MDRINHIKDAMDNGASLEDAEYSWLLHKDLERLLDLGYTHDEIIEACERVGKKDVVDNVLIGMNEIVKKTVDDTAHARYVQGIIGGEHYPNHGGG